MRIVCCPESPQLDCRRPEGKPRDYATATIVEGGTRPGRSLGDPRGTVWSAAGTRGYVTGMGSSNPVIINQNGLRAGAEQFELPNGPIGVVLDETRNQLRGSQANFKARRPIKGKLRAELPTAEVPDA